MHNQEDTVLSHFAEAVTNVTQHIAPKAAPHQALTSEVLLERIVTTLTEDKAEDLVQIPLRGKSEIADHMIICSGRSTRQVSALSEKLVDRLKQEFGLLCKVEGKDAGDWVLVDTGDVIVHIFRPEVREFYQLEKMWLSTGDEAIEQAPSDS